MVDEENTPEGEAPNEPATSAGGPSTGSSTSVKLTPGQRLAAKKAQKAVDKREAKEDRKRDEELERQKEQEEADRLFGRAQVEPALPVEVQKTATEFSDFMQHNRGRLVGGVVTALVVALGVIFGRQLLSRGSHEQAAELTKALQINDAQVDADDSDGKSDDGKPVFKSEHDRAEKALAAFDAVAKGDDLTARWAKLAGGASLVQLGKFDDAHKRFEELTKDKDPALATRALENAGIALEAAGKKDEASKQYEALSKLEGSKDLGEYHLARLQIARGDIEGGKTRLKALYDRLSTPTEGNAPSRYLRSEVEVRLAEIDSSLVDKGSSGGGGFGGGGGGAGAQQFTEEQIQRMIEQLQKQQQQQGK